MATIAQLIENKILTFSDFENFLEYYDVQEACYYAEPPQAVHESFYGKVLPNYEDDNGIFNIWFPGFNGNPDLGMNPKLPIELLNLEFKLTY